MPVVVGVADILSSKFCSSVTHEIDGLIFQPQPDPYEPGRCQTLLKWKPHHLNSIDFKLKIVRIHKEGMLPEYVGCLYVLHLQEPYAKMRVTKDLKQYDNKIIECCLEKGEWKFMRERRDKSFPNAFATAEEFVRRRAKKPRGSQKRLNNGQESNPLNKPAMPPPDSRPSEKLAKRGN
uniref:mRNA guanylyltransferase n=1 Tax=Romanomermis culicivorax TaxID=13658 RepID=A0A915JMX5_ROMCU